MLKVVLTGLVMLSMIVALTLLVALSPLPPSMGGGATLCPGGPPSAGTPAPPPAASEVRCVFGGRIADAALQVAQHLSGTPDVFYDAAMPTAALAYWQRVCPVGSSCWPYWQSGNLQCVQLVTGAFALAGTPLPAVGNAIDFWALYRSRPGWQEISVGALGIPPASLGLPEPGDMMVWASPPPGVGHIAIVLAVRAPGPLGQAGFVTFAEANGPGPIVTQSLLPDGRVLTWPGYVVYGYIRPV